MGDGLGADVTGRAVTEAVGNLEVRPRLRRSSQVSVSKAQPGPSHVIDFDSEVAVFSPAVDQIVPGSPPRDVSVPARSTCAHEPLDLGYRRVGVLIEHAGSRSTRFEGLAEG